MVKSGGKWVDIPDEGGEKMLIGEYQHTIDSKGRMIVPAKLREDLGEKFIVTKGINNCLFVYSNEEWINFSHKLRALPLTNKEAQAFIRLFFAGANECELDKQGRILIPSNLRQYANLEKDVVVIGVLSRVEIWSKEAWEAYNNNASSDYDEILEKMAELGI